MADQTKNSPAKQDQQKKQSSGQNTEDLQDWEIEHTPGIRKAHPGKGDHFVGNAAEEVEVPLPDPLSNAPQDQTRPGGNRPKGRPDQD